LSCEKKFRDALRRRGFRLTPQREAILEALHHAEGCLTAEALHERVCADPDCASNGIDLATVYRTLELLAAIDFVACIETGHKERLWEFRGDEAPRPHLLCRACGELSTLGEPEVAELTDYLMQRYGFAPSTGQLTIPGLCHKCRDQAQAGESKP
jgi:Fur family transcriptional regulator, ferric uptake regulator